jgi:hypothetical protein
MLDQGGELYNCIKIIDLFTEFNYRVFPSTGAMSSFQSGVVQSRIGNKTFFTNLQTIGCRVIVKPTTPRSAKSANNSISSIYLGPLEYTLKFIQCWYHPATQRVKIAYHCKIDEGFSDLPMDELPPNVKHLHHMQNGSVSDNLRDDVEMATPGFDISLHAFTEYTRDLTVTISCIHSTFGFILEQDKQVDQPALRLGL